jgi:hypothetical protein
MRGRKLRSGVKFVRGAKGKKKGVKQNEGKTSAGVLGLHVIVAVFCHYV